MQNSWFLGSLPSIRKWVRSDRKSFHKVLGVPVACVCAIPAKQERGPRLVLCLRKNGSVLRKALGVPFVGAGDAGGKPHVYVTTAISLAEFMFTKKGQWVAGVVGKARFGLVDFLPKI